MESFMELYQNTKRKLDRELHENELKFLQWVYDQYKLEPQNDKQVCGKDF